MFILYEALQHDGEMVTAPRGENKVIAATDGNRESVGMCGLCTLVLNDQ